MPDQLDRDAEHHPRTQRLGQPDGDGLGALVEATLLGAPGGARSMAMPPAERMKNRAWSSDTSRASAASVPRTTSRSQVRTRSDDTLAWSQVSTVWESRASAPAAVQGASGGTMAAMASSSRIAWPSATALTGSTLSGSSLS